MKFAWSFKIIFISVSRSPFESFKTEVAINRILK